MRDLQRVCYNFVVSENLRRPRQVENGHQSPRRWRWLSPRFSPGLSRPRQSASGCPPGFRIGLPLARVSARLISCAVVFEYSDARSGISAGVLGKTFLDLSLSVAQLAHPW